MKIRNLFCALAMAGLTSLVSGAEGPSSAPPAQKAPADLGHGGHRLSLLEMLKPLQTAKWKNEIPGEFRKNKMDSKVVQKWSSEMHPMLTLFQAQTQSGEGFVRGEIESEENLNLFSQFLEFSILDCRLDLQSENTGARACELELPVWFDFVADLTYDESSLMALRWAQVVRSLWLDEIEKSANDPARLLRLAKGLSALRAPWPMDRIFIAESARLKNQQSRSLFQKVANQFQKNPYQSVDEILHKIPAHERKIENADLDFLKKMWREADLVALKQEVHRIARLQVLLAKAQFAQQTGHPAKDFNELIAAHWLTQVPVDYLTGQAMSFTP